MVKGTGERRARYLKRAWYPSRALWASRQGSADRFHRSEAEREARAHGGVPVKLVAPEKIVSLVPSLKDFISEHAHGAPPKRRLHWIHGVDELPGSKYTEGECFCFECATKVVAQLQKRYPRKAEDVNLCVSGGYGSDEDGPRFCESCGAPLQHRLTDYGAEEEFNHFKTYPPARKSPPEWAAVDLACQNLPDDSPLWALVAHWAGSARKMG